MGHTHYHSIYNNIGRAQINGEWRREIGEERDSIPVGINIAQFG